MTKPGTNSGRRAWRLDLTVARRDGDLVMTLAGRLGAAATADLTTALADAVSGADRRIVLDLKGLDYINSAGVMALEIAAARLRSDGRELVLSGPTAPVRLALALAGFPDDVVIT